MRRNVTLLEIKYTLISNVLDNTPCFPFLNFGTVVHTLKLRKCLRIRDYHRTYENCPCSMWIPLFSCTFFSADEKRGGTGTNYRRSSAPKRAPGPTV